MTEAALASESILKRRGSSHAAPEVRYAQLMTAALNCFAEYGYHGTTMDKVAEVAGLSKGSLYRFFQSKEDLLLAMLDEWDRDLQEMMDAWPESMNSLERLKEYCFASISSVTEYRDLVPVWLEFFRHPKARERINSSYGASRKILCNFIRRGISEGSIRQVSPIQTADAVIALIEGMLIVSTVDKEFNPEKRFKGAWELLEHGLV